MRLIDADAMHKFVEDKVAEGKDGWANGVGYEWAWALTAVDMQPTIDPESLRTKGEWITKTFWKKRRGHHVQLVFKKCSLCNTRVKARWNNNFCPNCGADMRKEVASDIMMQPQEVAHDR